MPAIAALLPFVSTMAGGLATLRLRHRLHPFMAIAAGVLVASAVTNLLPEAHALAGPGAEVRVGAAVLVGFLAFSLVESFIHLESYEHQDDPSIPIDAPRPGERPRAGTGLVGLVPPASLVAHSTLDGLAIGLGFQAGEAVGLIVLLAVLAHDFADGMNVVTLALDAARGAIAARVLLVLDALAPVFGAALSTLVSIPAPLLGLLLAGFAGVFIAVGAAHLLPEAQHRRPESRAALVAMSGLGAAIVLGVRALVG